MNKIVKFYKQAAAPDLPKHIVKALEIGGLGTLAAPSIYHLAKGKHDPNKPPSKLDSLFDPEKKPFHAIEVAGLGALAVPHIAPSVIQKLKALRAR